LVAHQNDKIVPRPVEPIVIKNAGDIVPLLLTLHLNLILDESTRFWCRFLALWEAILL